MKRYLLIILAGIMSLSCSTPRKIFEKEVAENLSKVDSVKEIVNEKDLHGLPRPVQRYLKYTNIIGKEKAKVFSIKFNGQFKMKLDADWINVSTEQYNFIASPARIFHIRGAKGFIPVSGRDAYIDGKANMLIKVMSLFTVEDAKGYEMDISELVTVLNDMVYCPSAFLGDNIKWEAIDDTSAMAIITEHGMSASAIFFFNEEG